MSYIENGYRKCLGKFPTGVTVVSYEHHGKPHGITVNSFTSISLDPMLVLISIDKKAKAAKRLYQSSFIVNILNEDQKEIALAFAGKQQDNVEVNWEKGRVGSYIKDSLAYIECFPYNRYEVGDHLMFIGRVVDFNYSDDVKPLTFHEGNLK